MKETDHLANTGTSEENTDLSVPPLVIPYQQLSVDALNGILEEYITREGTDYGEVEVSLDTQIARAMGKLAAGEVLIVYDQVSERCHVVESQALDELAKHNELP